jgi:tRNA A-37 threonylcarbamoyl transferase component Bud32
MNRSLTEFASKLRGQPLLEVQFHVFADQIRRWQHGERLLMQDYVEVLPELKQIAPQTLLAQDRLLVEAFDTLTDAPIATVNTLITLAKNVNNPSVVPYSQIENTPVKNSFAPDTMSADDLPEIPNFSIEEKIGLGGMGVVYKARQTLPNRIVALKVMRYGRKQDIQRFLAEAEAIAKIQHPHIVGVLQVEMLKDQPILVLEYLPGGNLREKLDGKPQPATSAAILLRKVALAVQAAHDAGVIHRDLKPANILLDNNSEPKITDFGLAKHNESESGLTASGAIIGSPSYMAPEQAMGKIREIGTWTDVYALGAILYEMLTGRPPFLGEDPHETLLQVINQEPVSIRQLNPVVPRDLETICHKCLHKEPALRYSSAQALSEDLTRFIEGNPIIARRAGWLERSWRWMHRHPLICFLLIAIAGLLIAGMWIIWQYQLGRAQTSGYAGLRILFEKALTADFRRFESQQQIFQALLQSAELLEGKGIYSPEDSARHYQQLGRMASIQGEADQARKAWERALRLIAQAPEKTATLGLVESQLLLQLGKLDSDNGQWEKSMQGLNSAQTQLVKIIQTLNGDLSNDQARQNLRLARETYADTIHELANWQYRQRNYTEAAKSFYQAIYLRAGYLKELSLPGVQEDMTYNRSLRRGIARSYGYLGDVLRSQNDMPGATAAYAESESLRQALVDEQPADDEACFQLARSHENRCNLQARLGETTVALAALRPAEKLLVGITQEQPGIADYTYDLARVGSRLAVLLYDAKQASSPNSLEARRLWERSLQLAEGLRKRDKASLNYRGEWCYALVHLARLNDNVFKKPEHLKEARQILERLRQERNNPEDAYVLLLCELLEGTTNVKQTRAPLLDEVQKAHAFFPHIRVDDLFKGLWIESAKP